MAKENRFMVVEEGLKKLEAQFMAFVEENNSRVKVLEDNMRLLTQLLEKLRSEKFETLDPNVNNLPNGNGNRFILPEIKFPQFDEAKPRIWVWKCDTYFQLYNIVDSRMKLNLAALHLPKKAELWFHSYELQKGQVDWAEFCVDICNRFDVLGDDVLCEFKNLSQMGNVEDYLVKFEELMSGVMFKFPTLSESFFVASFIAGLKDEIKYAVRVHTPVSLSRAIEVARLQEKAFHAMTMRILMDPDPDPDPET